MNEKSEISLKNIKDEHIHQVADIHCKAFPESLLTDFGIETTKQYYRWQLTPPNLCDAIGAFNEKKLIGFCFSGAFRNAEIYFIKENILPITKEFLFHPALILNKKILIRFFETIRNYVFHFLKGDWKRSKLAQVSKERYGILAIAVDPLVQNSGIGKLIMDEVERISISKGFQKIELCVDPNNESAIRFYEKSGWLKTAFDPNGIWTGYMEKIIK